MNNGTKILLIIAGALILTGILMFMGVIMFANLNFMNLTNNKKYETNTYEITENFSKISVDVNTTDLRFVPSADGTCKVECYEEASEKHVVTVENGTLMIDAIRNKKWHDYIGINVDSPKLTVSLPKAQYDELIIQNNTGKITLPEELSFGTLEIDSHTGNVNCRIPSANSVSIRLTTGHITLSDLTAGNLTLAANTGHITASSVHCEDLSVTVTTGKVLLSDISCKNLTAKGSTGDLTMTNVLAQEKITLKRSTGKIELEACDGAELEIRTDTGDVEASLLSDKIFIAETDTGDVEIPHTTSGGVCEIVTDTGDIDIEIVK